MVALSTAVALGTDAQSLGANASGGMSIGLSAAELVSFHGATPVAQPSGSAQAAVATGAATTGAATYGLTSAQANGVVTLLNEIRTVLVNKGMMKGS